MIILDEIFKEILNPGKMVLSDIQSAGHWPGFVAPGKEQTSPGEARDADDGQHIGRNVAETLKGIDVLAGNEEER